MMSPGRLNPYPTHYRLAFAFSLLPYPPPRELLLRVAFLGDNELSSRRTTGLPRFVDVPVWVRSRLSAGGTTTAPEEFGASGPDHSPFLVQACQHLPLAYSNDVYQRFTYVDRTTQSWFPTPLMLGVTTEALRLQLPSVKEEATLCRELRTPGLPLTHVSVGYCGQYRR
jgi:hypothetical protein